MRIERLLAEDAIRITSSYTYSTYSMLMNTLLCYGASCGSKRLVVTVQYRPLYIEVECDGECVFLGDILRLKEAELTFTEEEKSRLHGWFQSFLALSYVVLVEMEVVVSSSCYSLTLKRGTYSLAVRSDAKTFSSFQNRILLTELYRTYSLRDASRAIMDKDLIHLLQSFFIHHPDLTCSLIKRNVYQCIYKTQPVASVLEAIYQTHVSLSPTLLCFTLQAPFLVTIYIQNPFVEDSAQRSSDCHYYYINHYPLCILSSLALFLDSIWKYYSIEYRHGDPTRKRISSHYSPFMYIDVQCSSEEYEIAYLTPRERTDHHSCSLSHQVCIDGRFHQIQSLQDQLLAQINDCFLSLFPSSSKPSPYCPLPTKREKSQMPVLSSLGTDSILRRLDHQLCPTPSPSPLPPPSPSFSHDDIRSVYSRYLNKNKNLCKRQLLTVSLTEQELSSVYHQSIIKGLPSIYTNSAPARPSKHVEDLSSPSSAVEFPKMTLSPVMRTSIRSIQQSLFARTPSSSSSPISITRDHLRHYSYVGQYDRSFLLFRSHRSLLAMDQHAAHERVNLDYYLYQVQLPSYSLPSYTVPMKPNSEGSIGNQRYCCTLSSTQHSMLMNNLSFFKSWKFDFYPVQLLSHTLNNTNAHLLQLTSVPILYAYVLTKEDFLNLFQDEHISRYTSRTQYIPLSIHELLKQRACKTAIQFHTPLSREEAGRLQLQLSYCDMFMNCAHGRPTLALLDSFYSFVLFYNTTQTIYSSKQRSFSATFYS